MKFFPKVGIIAATCFLLATGVTWAITVEECETKVRNNELTYEQALECEGVLSKLAGETAAQKKSLQSEISRFNASISITSAKIIGTTAEIKKLEGEINSLGEKIGQLDLSLDQLSKILIRRVAETYKKGRVNNLAIFFSSSDFSVFASRLKYLRVIQHHDRDLMVQLETVRTNFENQKTLKEQKQKELAVAKKKLEDQKNLLAQQKVDKERLLSETQNNEQRYQQLLASTRAELEAIQGIIAGRGSETEVGKRGAGDGIATIIIGASPCSTGTHLHFEVRDKGEVKNPFMYLKNITVIDNSGGDAFAASGSWDWPLFEPIKFNQGFGSDTSFIRSHAAWYDFHTGIDISAENKTIKAVKSGTLFRGSIACGSGTLRYVRMDHDESDIDTYYLHVNY